MKKYTFDFNHTGAEMVIRELTLADDQGAGFTADELANKLVDLARYDDQLDEIADLWDGIETPENNDSVRIGAILEARIEKHRARRRGEAAHEMKHLRDRIERANGGRICGEGCG